jgi:acyl carrier protein phosphodiesterase
MTNQFKQLKKNLKELADNFKEEQNHFRRCVLIYDYVEFLNTEQLIKESLGELFVEANNKIEEEPEIELPDDEESFMRSKIGWENNFWVYYANFLFIHNLMIKFKSGKNRIKTLEQIEHAMARSYATDLLEISFKIVNDKLFEKLGQKEFIGKHCQINRNTTFNKGDLSLYIKGEKVKISTTGKITNAAKILKHIFITNKDNLTDDFYYSEIAQEEFEDQDYKKDQKGWRKYFDACGKIQTKIKKATKNNISDFLIYSSGQAGKTKVNQKYL